MFFWNSLAFLMIQQMLAIWSLVPLLEHLKVHISCTVEALPGEFWALLCWSVRWVQSCGSLNILWHCPFLELEWKLTFSSPVATAEFSKFSDILATSSFSIFNSSAGIPSLPLAFFVVMLPQAHLTSHYRSRWVTTPLWLSRSLKPFLYSSSVYSCHLFLISSVRPLPFLSWIVPLFVLNVPLVSPIFLMRSLVFPIFFSFNQ